MRKLRLSHALIHQPKGSPTGSRLRCTANASPNFSLLVVCNSPESWKCACLRYFACVVGRLLIFRVLVLSFALFYGRENLAFCVLVTQRMWSRPLILVDIALFFSPIALFFAPFWIFLHVDFVFCCCEI